MPSQYILFPPCSLNGSRFAAGDAADDGGGLGRDNTLFLIERSWFSSCSSSSLTRSLNRSISLSRCQSIYAPSKGSENGPDCMGKGPHFIRPLVTTLSPSAVAVGAWIIAVTLDAMYTAPVTSSGDLVAFWSCRRCQWRRRRARLIMMTRTGRSTHEGGEHDDANVGRYDEGRLSLNFCSGLHGWTPLSNCRRSAFA